MSLRSAQYSTDLLIAEVFAAPFWMPVAMKQGICELDRMVSGDSTTRALYRKTESYVIERFPSTNLDELLSVRDRIWFPPSSGDKIELHWIALSLAGILADYPGVGRETSDASATDFRTSILSVSDNLAGNRLRLFRRLFYWLSTALPADFLKALVQHQSRLNPTDRGIRLCGELLDSDGLSRNVRHMLRSRGMAETHLHLGAAFQFAEFWIALLHRLGSRQFKSNAFESAGAHWDDGRELASLCVHGGIVRILLARFLADRYPFDQSELLEGGFAQWLSQNYPVDHPALKPSRVEHYSNSQDFAAPEPSEGADRAEPELPPAKPPLALAHLSEVRHTVRFLLSGQLKSTALSFRNAQAVYRRLLRLDGKGNPAPKELLDPIQGDLPRTNKDSSETLLTRYALSYMVKHDDQTFKKCFWQYQRIRNSVYRHIVHRPMTPGIQWFLRHFERLAPGKNMLPVSVQLNNAMKTSGKQQGLRSLEIRTSPTGSFRETLRFVNTVYEFARAHYFPNDKQSDHADRGQLQRDPVEVGLVFHLVKNRGSHVLAGNANANGKKTAEEPGIYHLRSQARTSRPQYGSVPRFYGFYSRTTHGVQNVKTLFKQYPLALQIVRGFDACTDELGIQNWVLVPFYQQMRRAAMEARRECWRRYGIGVPLPRSTIHAGEDFVHVLTGLRSIDEAIQWLELSEGDRIGHGLALGVDAESWAHEVGDVTLPAEQRLLDLVWERDFCSQADIESSVSRIQFVNDSIDRLSQFIFGPAPSRARYRSAVPWPPSYRDLSILRRNLACPELVRIAGFHHSYSPANHSRNREIIILNEYLFRYDVFQRGQKNIVVSSRQYAKELANLQKCLRDKIERMDIAIEVNPSSNLLLGDFGDLQSHPLWRLNSPETANSSHAIPIVVGSDDPIIFASSLPQEYQKLADALSNHGYSETATLEWLDCVRETGMRYRFTIPAGDFLDRKMMIR